MRESADVDNARAAADRGREPLAGRDPDDRRGDRRCSAAASGRPGGCGRRCSRRGRRPGPRQPRPGSAAPPARGDPGADRRARPDDVPRVQRHPPRRGARGGRGDRHRPLLAAAPAASARARLAPEAPAAALPQPPGADGPGRAPRPGRRQPPRLARGPRPLAHPRRRDRRRDRGGRRGDLPRRRGRGRLPPWSCATWPAGTGCRPPIYRDGSSVFAPTPGARSERDEATQVGRALAELGIASIAGRARPRPRAGSSGPVGHLPGPARVRAAPGRGAPTVAGANDGPARLPPPLQPPLRGPGGEPGPGLAAGARRARPRPGAAPSAGGGRSATTARSASMAPSSSFPPGPGGRSLAGGGSRSSCASTAASSCSPTGACSPRSRPHPSRAACARCGCSIRGVAARPTGAERPAIVRGRPPLEPARAQGPEPAGPDRIH